MVRYTGRPVPFPDSMEMERLENRELVFPLFSEEEQQPQQRQQQQRFWLLQHIMKYPQSNS